VRNTRKAYTLFELLLVMAIILVLAALAYPSLTGSYAQTKGTASADSVKAAWTSARSQAMKENRPYRFAVVWNKGSYRVAPDSEEFWSGTPSDSADPAKAPLVIEESLPEGVTFRGSDQGSTDSSSDWSTVVVFNPDGTASEDTEVSFQSQGGSGATLKLKAFTGTASVQ